jgi:hypothetical protein
VQDLVKEGNFSHLDSCSGYSTVFQGFVRVFDTEQFRAATERDAVVGRLRKNVTLRRVPSPARPGKRGRPALHGPVLCIPERSDQRDARMKTRRST